MLVVPISPSFSRGAVSPAGLQFNAEDQLYNNLTEAIEIREHDENKTIDGHTIFTLARCMVNPESPRGWSVVDTGFMSIDMAGDIEYYQSGFRGLTNKLINSTTVVKAGLPAAPNNLSFWNMATNTSEVFPVPSGHHDFVYNPVDEEFMILTYESSNEMWNGLQVGYDDIWIYDAEGNVKWHWNATEQLPFNSSMYDSDINQTFHGRTDWMHGNALVWDWENDAVYYNVRNLNTFYKINTETKEIEWGAGEYGDFTLIDEDGNEVNDSLWFQSHSLERIGSNRFMMFDNDMYNYSNPDSMAAEHGHSRYIELVVDEDAGTVRETWTWSAPDDTVYYFPRSGGDADRLPNGNTLGIFGVKGNAFPGYSYSIFLTEVTPEGDIAWEAKFQNTTDYYYWIYRVQRSYDAPLVELGQVESGTLELQTWNAYYENHESPATVSILEGSTVLAEESFNFSRYWQATDLSLDLPALSGGTHNLTISVENADGSVGSASITVEIPANYTPFILAGAGAVVIVVALVVYMKKR